MRLVSFVAAACAFLYAARPAAQDAPAQPQAFVDTTFIPPTGRTILVRAGGDVQAAIDAANAGDAIALEAGSTFTGNFTLRRKAAGDGREGIS